MCSLLIEWQLIYNNIKTEDQALDMVNVDEIVDSKIRALLVPKRRRICYCQIASATWVGFCMSDCKMWPYPLNKKRRISSVSIAWMGLTNWAECYIVVITVTYYTISFWLLSKFNHKIRMKYCPLIFQITNEKGSISFRQKHRTSSQAWILLSWLL